MTRKEALAELIAKVEAGDATAVDIYEVMGRGGLHAIGAYNGSLDAAKALHEAVLDGWTMDQMNQWHEDGTPRGWAVHLLRHKPLPKKREQGSGFGITPARAWLFAILRALHAMEAAE